MERRSISSKDLAQLEDQVKWIDSDVYKLERGNFEQSLQSLNPIDKNTSFSLKGMSQASEAKISSSQKTKHPDSRRNRPNMFRRRSDQNCQNYPLQLQTTSIINPFTLQGNNEFKDNVPFYKEKRTHSLKDQFLHMPSSCDLPKQSETNLVVNLYIETKNSQLGPYHFEIYSKMNIGLLKLKVEKELFIPSSCQRWILNNALALDDDASVLDYGTTSGSSIFLYVDSNHKSNFDIEKLSGILGQRAFSMARAKSFDLNTSSFNICDHFQRISSKESLNEGFLNAFHIDSFEDNCLHNKEETRIKFDTGTEVVGNLSEALITEESSNNKIENKIIKKNNVQLSCRRKTVRLKRTKKDISNADSNSNLDYSSVETKCSSSNRALVTEPIKNNSKSFDVVNKDLNFEKEPFSSFDTPNSLCMLEMKNNFNLSCKNSNSGCSYKNFDGISECDKITMLQKPKKSFLQQLRAKQKLKDIALSSKNLVENDLTPNTASLSKLQNSAIVSESNEIKTICSSQMVNTLEDSNLVNLTLQEVVKSCSDEGNPNTVCKVPLKDEDVKLNEEDNRLDGIIMNFSSESLHEVVETEKIPVAHQELNSSENDSDAFKASNLSQISIEDCRSEEAVDKSLSAIENEQEQKHKDELNHESVENYEFLLRMENSNLVRNVVNFTCPICFGEFESDQGVVLHECLHTFCLECLGRTVEYAEETLIKCPYRDDEYSCQSFLQQREIKALVPAEVYERYLQRSITTAESLAEKSFHCKTPDCLGWCLFENNINIFHCPICSHYNCLNCSAQHEGLNCRQYQDKLKSLVKSDPDSEKTLELLNKMIDSGKAMKCPKCDLILMKKWGCDWLKCSVCLTEICWITKGPRWGPAGQGDTSAGCRCGMNGVKCHPSCTYCH